MQKEIERRWLLPKMTAPDKDDKVLYLGPVTEMLVYHWYLKSTDDFQFRIGMHIMTSRSANNPTDAFPMVFTLNTKKGSGLSRLEGECNLLPEQFNALIGMCSAPGDPICKKYELYERHGHTFEVCDVDGKFVLVEVEFESEEAAKKFNIGDYFFGATEVTDNPHYLMKNYWKETREKND